MAHFIIDGFDFGVDASRSSCDLREGGVYLKIVGEAAVVANPMSGDDERWNWLIHPPFLYVARLPCAAGPDGNFEHEITEQEFDDYDVALYMMEHWDVLARRDCGRQGTPLQRSSS